MWILVKNPDLQSFRYADYGMEKAAEVTTNGKAQVPEDVAERLFDHPSGDFVPIDDDEPVEPDAE